MREDEMVGWHPRLHGHEFEQAPGVGDGQGSLACCSLWGHKESDTTERLNWTDHEKYREGPWSGLPIPVESLEPSRTPWPKAVLRAFWDEPVNMENFLYRKFHQLLQWFYHSTVFEEKIFKCERKEPSKWKQLWKGYSNFIWRVCYHLTHAHGLFESDRNCHINLCNTNFVNNN